MLDILWCILVMVYVEWVLVILCGVIGLFIIIEMDDIIGVMLVCNLWSIVFFGRIFFFDFNG